MFQGIRNAASTVKDAAVSATNLTTGAVAYAGKTALNAAGKGVYMVGSNALQQFGSISGYDQDPNWIFVKDAITMFETGDFAFFLEKYGDTIASKIPTIIRILQCSSAYVMNKILSILYANTPDLPTKFRKLILMFTLIIKGLDVNETEKYNKIYESVDAGKKAGNFMGLLGDDAAGLKDLFIGFQYLYLFPERSRKNDVTLEKILDVINVDDTILILSTILPVLEYLRDNDTYFELPPLPCGARFRSSDPILTEELDNLNKCLVKEKKDTTNRYLTFAINLVRQSIDGLINQDKSRYFLPIFILSLIHRVHIDLLEFETVSFNVKNQYPYMSDDEIAVKVRKQLPKFALVANATKKGGFHTLKRRHKRSRRRGSRSSGRSNKIRNKYGLRSRRFPRSYEL